MMQCVCGATTYQLVSPSQFQPEMEPLVATHQSLNRMVRRQHRLGAPTHEWRISISWEELTEEEVAVIQNVWMFLKDDGIANLTDPSGRTLVIRLNAKDRALEIAPYAAPNGNALHKVSLIVRGY